uniref:Uncharacterized protein n=1 Tax=Anguilla anguilla TaxID=7936 RepID=A0A0E9TQ70_ANGAN
MNSPILSLEICSGNTIHIVCAFYRNSEL